MRTKFIIIPDPLLADERLNLHSKILFGHIFRLSKSKGYCWATNSALAEIMQRDDRSVQRWIKELSDHGYITMTVQGWRREIFCNVEGLEEPPIVERKRRRPEWKNKQTPDDTKGVEGDYLDGDRTDVGGRLTDAKNGDQIDVQKNIKNKTSTTTTGDEQNGRPVSPVSPPTLFPQTPVLLSRGSNYWQTARSAFITNRIFLEKMCTSKRIAPAAVEALMVHFCDDLELRDDIGSADRLQSHFIHWYNKGINQGFILADGTLKNKPIQQHEQSTNNREKTANDILQQFGDDRQ